MTQDNITDAEYIIAGLSQAIADELPQALVWQAWEMAESGAQFDAAVSASVQMKDITHGDHES